MSARKGAVPETVVCINSYQEYDTVVVRELSRFGRDPLTVLQDVEEIVDSYCRT
ncbi:hypothetical protein [Natronomonas sp. LN261]|uniref:hypothetical protein n=1 Tax=Natronomonas sp. LN261 TaxID=2750669 RepID=UPI0015EF59E9|nr:hypothetical protein [Natronomonas sp. LN261]